MSEDEYERVCVDKNAMAAGAALIFLSFVRDYAGIIMEGRFYKDHAGLADDADSGQPLPPMFPRTTTGVFSEQERHLFSCPP